MLRRIIAWSILLSPLAVPAAGAAVRAPSGPPGVTAHTAAVVTEDEAS